MWLQIGWQLQTYKSKVNVDKHMKISKQRKSKISITYLFMGQYKIIRE